ncbi:CRAL-TRIO domain-containing protein, partial [Syncephalis pseudoplumigaleata]
SLEEMRQEFWNLIMHDHPDSLLLRFLRARKWEVAKALSAAVNTLQWRIREDVAGIIRDGEAALNTRPLQLGQSYLHGTDRNQRPVCYINVRYHNKELQPFQDIRRFTIWVMETTRLMIHAPVETADIIFDLADFTMANMDFKFVKFIIQCFQAYYPESLGVYIVSSAPIFFWGVWQMITPWLDPVVASKFHCARKLTELQEFIAPENLPPRLSGTDDYEYYYPPPRAEDDVRLQDVEGREAHQATFTAISDRFVEATRKWIDAVRRSSSSNDDGSGSGSGSGGEDAEAIEAFKARDPIAAEMSVAYFKLDPYIRARTFYHRLGVLGEDGSCDW